MEIYYFFMISVLIPSDDNYYHIYAEGVFVSQHNDNNQTEIVLDDNYPFILYYYFPYHSRIYICCTKEKCSKNLFSLYNVNKDFSIIAVLEGRRSFDRFKRTMDYLNQKTDGEVYKLPVSFFWQLAYLCKFGKNSSYNIEKLTKRYNYKITYKKDVQWFQKNSSNA